MKTGSAPRLRLKYAESNPVKVRHNGDGGAAKKLKSASNVARFSATHIKSRMKRY